MKKAHQGKGRSICARWYLQINMTAGFINVEGGGDPEERILVERGSEEWGCGGGGGALPRVSLREKGRRGIGNSPFKFYCGGGQRKEG